MKKSVSVLVAALFSLTMFNFAVAQEGDAAAGQGKSTLCASCHGVDGNSQIAVNPKLAGQNASYIVKQLMDFKSGARASAIMAPMVLSLSEQDMADIAAWFASQTVTLEGADPAAVEIAEKLYRGGNADIEVAACTACHSPTGQGNAPAGFPALSGQHPDYTLAQLKAFRSGERSNDGDEVMRTIAERLTDRELEALSSYLSGLN